MKTEISSRRKTDQEILQALVDSAPYYQAGSKDDLVISICDREKWLLQLNHPKLSLDVKAGDPVSKDDPVIQAALNGQEGAGRPPIELYGVHFFGKTTPIFNDQGKVIGAMGHAYGIETILEIEESIDQLNEIAVEVRRVLSGIVELADKLTQTNDHLYDASNKARENSEEIQKILDIINDISRQSNILGLNANIEASRAGKAGLGFNVVANEIRILSQQTKDSSDKIETSIGTIRSNIEHILNGISDVQGVSSEQIQLIKTVEATLGTLSSLIKIVNDLIKKLG
ncbi:methyl-accepting chemotaxis protein [Halalkalibacter akibai]|uniref:Methyl-accepting chemotaxis protein n=1 Tax=Halalkalibacter akibai (strain ATCC 43226 / DSM 21942 / CIP 109018 / JCM 9157 / 1139) TaxID=1236973 RepID=W4QZL7_HALA3|nr:methyl-accepting chemotaxis protein [Halalkalibacter akibai]GAE37113.1 methyl-accepting chemotaxis protein [Halalkalibacter akibai JCM 9157]